MLGATFSNRNKAILPFWARVPTTDATEVSLGARADLGVRSVVKARRREALGGQEGCQQRPACFSTPTSSPLPPVAFRGCLLPEAPDVSAPRAAESVDAHLRSRRRWSRSVADISSRERHDPCVREHSACLECLGASVQRRSVRATGATGASACMCDGATGFFSATMPRCAALCGVLVIARRVQLIVGSFRPLEGGVIAHRSSSFGPSGPFVVPVILRPRLHSGAQARAIAQTSGARACARFAR